MTDDLDIPEFLRIPQARRKAAWAKFTPRPSRTTESIERWRQYERQRQDEAKQKTMSRIEELRARKGLETFYEVD